MDLQTAQNEVTRAENDQKHYQSQLDTFDQKLKKEEQDLQEYRQKELEVRELTNCLLAVLIEYTPTTNGL